MDASAGLPEVAGNQLDKVFASVEGNGTNAEEVDENTYRKSQIIIGTKVQNLALTSMDIDGYILFTGNNPLTFPCSSSLDPFQFNIQFFINFLQSLRNKPCIMWQFHEIFCAFYQQRHFLCYEMW